MKKLVSILFSVFMTTFWCVSMAKDKPGTVTLDFTGSPKPGMTFDFRIRSIRTRNCEMKVVGMRQPPTRRDTREILAGGKLFFREQKVANGILIKELEFEVDSISGFINGTRQEFPEFTGKTILISVKGDKVSFRKKSGDSLSSGKELASDVLSGGSVSSRTQEELPPELLYFFQSIFGNVTDSPRNYLGKSTTFELGKHHEVDTTPVILALQQMNIPAKKNEVESFAEYDGDTIYMGLPVRRLNLLIQGAGIPCCDFKLGITLFYPYGKNAPASGPVRISRKGMIVINSFLPKDNAFLPGSILETVETDMTDIQLIPEGMLKN